MLAAEGFSDDNWAGCTNSRKYTSILCFLSQGEISQRSRKQTFIATSTCEAEYISMSLAAKESLWLSRLLANLQNTEVLQAIFLGVDNNGAIEIAKNALVNQRNKHIDLQYHFIRNAYYSKQIELRHFNSENRLADSLTSPLDQNLFSKIRKSRGLAPQPF